MAEQIGITAESILDNNTPSTCLFMFISLFQYKYTMSNFVNYPMVNAKLDWTNNVQRSYPNSQIPAENLPDGHGGSETGKTVPGEKWNR